LKIRRNSISALYSYTGKTFSDALNTVEPPATGAVGEVPDYGLFDLNSSVWLFDFLSMRVNLNNVFDKKYFTKRPAFYPGPGVWPSEGRNLNLSFIVKI
jgi:Fe(3+) dicitrate transport protein